MPVRSLRRAPVRDNVGKPELSREHRGRRHIKDRLRGVGAAAAEEGSGEHRERAGQEVDAHRHVAAVVAVDVEREEAVLERAAT